MKNKDFKPKDKNLGIRIILKTEDKAPVLLEHIRRLNKIVNCASRQLLEPMQDATIIDEFKRKDDSVQRQTNFLKLKYCSENSKASNAQKMFSQSYPIRDCMNRYGYELSRIERMAYGMAAKFYVGMSQRNGSNGAEIYESKNAPTTGNFKSIHYIDGMANFRFDKNVPVEFEKTRSNKLTLVKYCVVNIKTHLGNMEFEFVVRDSQTQNLLNFFKRKRVLNSAPIEGNFVANLKFNSNGTIDKERTTFHFVVNNTEPYIWSYEAETTLGIDFNKRKDVFVVFSDDEIANINVKHQVELNKLISERTEIEKQIADSLKSVEIVPVERTGYRKFKTRKNEKQFRHKLKSKERRKLRLRWLQLGKLIEQDIIKCQYVEQIISEAQKRKAVLAIDDVKFAQNTGFGHSQLKALLVKRCNELNIPHVLVTTKFTSQICHECYKKGVIARLGRNDSFNLVSCSHCQSNYDADRNAAKIIAEFGSEIWNERKYSRPNWKDAQPKFKDYSNLDDDVLF